MRMRTHLALASLLTGLCLLLSSQAGAAELLDRMLYLGGAGCGCDSGKAAQKGGAGQHGGKHACGATQNNCGACQKSCCNACQKGGGLGVAQHGGKASGACQKDGACQKGGLGHLGAAQHGKSAGGKGHDCCSTPILDTLKEWTVAAKCNMHDSMHTFHCSIKTQADRLHLGHCCESGKGSKGGDYSPSYPSAPQAAPSYSDQPGQIAPPPAPDLDPSA